jgi:hypothetical protein
MKTKLGRTLLLASALANWILILFALYMIFVGVVRRRSFPVDRIKSEIAESRQYLDTLLLPEKETRALQSAARLVEAGFDLIDEDTSTAWLVGIIVLCLSIPSAAATTLVFRRRDYPAQEAAAV